MFVMYGSADEQDFSGSDIPFAFESHPAFAWARKLPFSNKAKGD